MTCILVFCSVNYPPNRYNISSVNGPADAIKDDLYGRFSNETKVVKSRPTDDPEGLFAVVESCQGKNLSSCGACLDDSLDCEMQYLAPELQAEQDRILTDRENSYATAVSIFTIGGIIGSFSVKFVVTKFGRKGSQLLNMIISIAAAANFIGAKHYQSNACLLAARVLIGLFAGIATGVCPMYIMELSSKEDRGWVGVLNQLLITIGILVAQIISLPGLMGKPDLWGYLMSLTAIPAVIWIISYGLSVESPRFTLIEQNKEEEAEAVLIKLRGTTDVKSEMDEMRIEARQAESEESMSIMQLLTAKELRWQLISICLMMISQQLSGK